MTSYADFDAEYRAIPYGKPKSAERLAYPALCEKVNERFKNWLVAEYTPHFSAVQQDFLWHKAWSDGHSAGYHEVENKYADYALFAETVINQYLEDEADGVEDSINGSDY